MSVSHHETLALAAIFSIAADVDTLAVKGRIDEARLSTFLQSVIQINPQDFDCIYGGVEPLQYGLHVLGTHLESQRGLSGRVTHYVAAMIHLSRHYIKGKEATALGNTMQDLQQQYHQWQWSDSMLVQRFAGVYSAHISGKSPKIIVP